VGALAFNAALVRSHGEESIARRSAVSGLLTIVEDALHQTTATRSSGDESARVCSAGSGFPDSEMPFFRIAAALSILALIQPEALRAPLRFVAANLSDFAGKAQEPRDQLTKACIRAPKRCADLAAELLKANPDIPTGAVRQVPKK
jgi:hypothetical protein